jgi:MFS family permease
MKAVDKGEGGALPRSVGLYTFSWSTGMATGPFVSAFIWNRFGWQPCYALDIALCAATALGVFLLKHHAEEHPAATEKLLKNKTEPKRHSAIDYSTMPDLAWLGWLCSGIGCLAVAMLRSYLPSSATATGIPRAEQGMLLALASGSQALTGLALCRSRLWMYKPLPVALFGICGVSALFGFGSSSSFLPLALSSILFGVSSGAFFFYLVFHSLVHPEHSTRYVAVNESVVGFTSMLGPLLAGFLAAGLSISAPYRVSALLLLASVALQAWVTWHSRKSAPPTTGETP